ncbi:MAG: twin-arginine translocase TatA/TatE family subunit [Cellulosilyticaceae bacterium]
MFGKIGGTELIIVLIIVLVIFGPKQLPKLGKTFGKTLKGFKDGVGEQLNDEDTIE